MKKLTITLSMIFVLIFTLVSVPKVSADATNLFDSARATRVLNGGFIDDFIYYDASLPTGNYTITFYNITTQPGPELANLMFSWDYDTRSFDNMQGDGSLVVTGSSGNFTYSITVDEFVEGMFHIYYLEPQAKEPILDANALTTANYSIVMNEVDDLEPTFSYSNLQVTAPYNNVPTAASIQAQLTAIDDIDGDVTSQIVIDNDHYTGYEILVDGDYYILFKVGDQAGNFAYLRVDIEIIDNIKPYISYNSQTYTDGQSITMPSWYNDDTETEKVTVDEIDDLITSLDGYYVDNWNPESGWYISRQYDVYNHGGALYEGENPYTDTPGQYDIILTLTDPSGNAAEITFLVTVLENHTPTITGPDTQTVEITSFNFASILAQYTASDIEDGTITLTVDASTTWNYASPTIGTFNLVLRATDSNGKFITKTVVVTVRDTTIPVFKISNISVTSYAVTVNMSDTTTLQALIDSIVITDAYYGTITGSKVVPTLPSLSIPGLTNITITCTDASGNIGSLALAITVADDILPVINGPVKVVKGRTATLVTADITALLTAIDNVSGSLSVVIVSDGYSGNAQTVGSYLVTYKATDSAGNIKYHDVRVWVIDNVAPVWVFDDYFINLGVNESMTRTELIALLQASGMIPVYEAYTVTFLTDEYTGNEEIEGAYNVVMRITYANGSQSDISVQLSVPAVEDDGDVIIVEPDVPQTGIQVFFGKVVDFATTVWNGIKTAATWVKNAAVWTYDNIIYPVYEFMFVKEAPITIPPVTTNTNQTTTSITTTQLPATTGTTDPLQNLSFNE